MRGANRFRLIAALPLAMLLLLGAGDDSARVEKLGHKLICMCGCNQILLECNHYGCGYMTPESKQLAAAVDRGQDDRTILTAFVEEYGPTVLAAPTTKGFELIAWVLPYLVLAMGVGGVILAARSWRKRSATVPAPPSRAQAAVNMDRFRAQARKETEI